MFFATRKGMSQSASGFPVPSHTVVPAWSRFVPFDFSTNPSEPSPSDNGLHSRLSATIRVCYPNMIRSLADPWPLGRCSDVRRQRFRHSASRGKAFRPTKDHFHDINRFQTDSPTTASLRSQHHPKGQPECLPVLINVRLSCTLTRKA